MLGRSTVQVYGVQVKRDVGVQGQQILCRLKIHARSSKVCCKRVAELCQPREALHSR